MKYVLYQMKVSSDLLSCPPAFFPDFINPTHTFWNTRWRIDFALISQNKHVKEI